MAVDKLQLGLVVTDGLDLGGRAALGIKAVGEPFGGQLFGQLNPDDALAEAQHLGVVAQDGALNGEGIVGSDGADARHLVGGDGDPEASATDEEAAVSLPLGDELGPSDGWVRIGGLVISTGDANVGNGLDERVLLEEGLDGLLVGDSGVIAGQDDAQRLEVRRHGTRNGLMYRP